MSSIRHYRKAEFILYNSKSESSISYTINFPKMKDFFQNKVTATGTNLYLLFLFSRDMQTWKTYILLIGELLRKCLVSEILFFCCCCCLFVCFVFIFLTELIDHKWGWAPKNWCFQIVILEKTSESHMYSNEIKPVNLKGNQFWKFIVRTDAKAEAPILWPPEWKSRFIGKNPDVGKDWRLKKGEAELEMVRKHHQLNGH